jgi:signal transduction histidine kinase
MLQWARSQTRQLEVQPEEIDVSELIQDNINLLQNKAEEKKIQLEKDIQEEAVKAFGDENMINTVIRNLISNAIKFTPEQGKVIIHTRPQDHHWLYLAVIDNGVGIARENISKLFDLNTGYTTHGTHSEKGTGLGLILCKEFVQMNGGEIGVESEENKGSTFWITIPRDKSTGEKHQKSHSQTYENL